jgi:CMP-N-acetylneuraminic acid synthetase
MSPPLVSIYIPNFNYSAYIESAIQSVLSQTFSDLELLIIDDGSTDGSRTIISRYELEARVRIIYQDNLGLNRTNNVALRAVRGKYIMRLDADDILDRNAVLVMVNELERNSNVGLVFPDYYYIDAAGTILGQERRHDFDSNVSLYDQPAHGACTMIRTDALREVSGYSELYKCQDGFDLWLKILGRYAVKNINLPLFYYRRHSTNLTENNGLILETRDEIKRTHVLALNRVPIETLAIIPERGRRSDPASQALETLGGKPLIDWTIEAALLAPSVKQVVVSTPDDDILNYVRRTYDAKVIGHRRDIDLARENVSVDRTVDNVLSSPGILSNLEAYVFLNASFPLRPSTVIESALNTMRLFEVDSVIGVVPETDMFFRHTGHGLELVGDPCQYDSLRLERDSLYRMSGGIHVVSADFYRRTGLRIGGRIGHVVLDLQSSSKVTDGQSLRKLEVALPSFRKRADAATAPE